MGLKQTIYLSGPITGHINYQVVFANYERYLVEQGYEVMNHAKLDDPKNPPPWHECIIRDLGFVVNCDIVALLPGWHESHGARIEVLFALRLGKCFMPLDNAVIGIDFHLGMSMHEEDKPWGDEEDLENDDEKGWEDLGGMGDIPGWL